MTHLDDEFLGALVSELDLEQKVRLLTGRDFWTTWPIEEIGLRAMVLSDGPSGVRGPVWDERQPSLNLPSATCLSASWDPAIARRYGNVAAVEARRKGVDVVLGPTVNIHRSPLGGRHFEAFSEDPRLTAELAAAVVTGLQENGVAATPKHYVANDSETERFTMSSEVSERALREVYLLAFEPSITEAHAWLVMSAYNSINGVTATEHDLLETPLNSEWGFDGVVVSDWTAVRSVQAAAASQDLVMPGPGGPWGAALVTAVRTGVIDETLVDRKVCRLLRLAARVGALEGVPAACAQPVAVEDGVAFAREAAVEGLVLVRNDGVLPLDPAGLTRVAVIGDNAVRARTQGGGSATVLPEAVVSPFDGLCSALPDVDVVHALGAVVQRGVGDLPLSQLRNPVTGGGGVHVRFLDADGNEMFAEDRFSTALVYFGGDAPIGTSSRFEVTTTWTPEVTGSVRLGFATIGSGDLFVDGELIGQLTATFDDGDIDGEGDPAAALLAPPSASVPIEVEGGRSYDVRVLYDMATRSEALAGAFSITVGVDPDDSDPDGLIAEAVAVAESAEFAVVVVGTNAKVESEGYDRTDLLLPGRQDDLVNAVAATGTPTIVVVNSGSPVEMAWRNDVAAVLLGWFGGQQMGEALADVLTGVAEPGGRLPTTWPVRTDDVPVLDVTPVDGKVHYDEGIHVGYRAWLRAGIDPAYPFGSGFGYTTWSITDLAVTSHASPTDEATLEVTVANTGARRGKQVVQVYLERAATDVERPVRWLAASAVVRFDAGQRTRVSIRVPARAFAHWADGWQYEPGTFGVAVGTSSIDLALTASIDLTT